MTMTWTRSERRSLAILLLALYVLLVFALLLLFL